MAAASSSLMKTETRAISCSRSFLAESFTNGLAQCIIVLEHCGLTKLPPLCWVNSSAGGDRSSRGAPPHLILGFELSSAQYNAVCRVMECEAASHSPQGHTMIRILPIGDEDIRGDGWALKSQFKKLATHTIERTARPQSIELWTPVVLEDEYVFTAFTPFPCGSNFGRSAALRLNHPKSTLRMVQSTLMKETPETPLSSRSIASQPSRIPDVTWRTIPSKNRSATPITVEMNSYSVISKVRAYTEMKDKPGPWSLGAQHEKIRSAASYARTGSLASESFGHGIDESVASNFKQMLLAVTMEAKACDSPVFRKPSGKLWQDTVRSVWASACGLVYGKLSPQPDKFQDFVGKFSMRDKTPSTSIPVVEPEPSTARCAIRNRNLAMWITGSHFLKKLQSQIGSVEDGARSTPSSYDSSRARTGGDRRPIPRSRVSSSSSVSSSTVASSSSSSSLSAAADSDDPTRRKSANIPAVATDQSSRRCFLPTLAELSKVIGQVPGTSRPESPPARDTSMIAMIGGAVQPFGQDEEAATSGEAQLQVSEVGERHSSSVGKRQRDGGDDSPDASRARLIGSADSRPSRYHPKQPSSSASSTQRAMMNAGGTRDVEMQRASFVDPSMLAHSQEPGTVVAIRPPVLVAATTLPHASQQAESAVPDRPAPQVAAAASTQPPQQALSGPSSSQRFALEEKVWFVMNPKEGQQSFGALVEGRVEKVTTVPVFSPEGGISKVMVAPSARIAIAMTEKVLGLLRRLEREECLSVVGPRQVLECLRENLVDRQDESWTGEMIHRSLQLLGSGLKRGAVSEEAFIELEPCTEDWSLRVSNFESTVKGVELLSNGAKYGWFRIREDQWLGRGPEELRGAFLRFPVRFNSNGGE